MARSPTVMEYRGRFGFDQTPEQMWGSLEHCERFEAWWAWLEEFRLEGVRLRDGEVLHGLEDGVVLHGVVSPPVPYRMRVRVVLDHCDRPHRIDATVHGDLEGEAALVLSPDGDGTCAEVWWTIEMMQRPMRVAARMARPLLRWGHDRVVEATVHGYRRHVAAELGG